LMVTLTLIPIKCSSFCLLHILHEMTLCIHIPLTVSYCFN
jgi:hypothetical protein